MLEEVVRFLGALDGVDAVLGCLRQVQQLLLVREVTRRADVVELLGVVDGLHERALPSLPHAL